MLPFFPATGEWAAEMRRECDAKELFSKRLARKYGEKMQSVNDLIGHAKCCKTDNVEFDFVNVPYLLWKLMPEKLKHTFN